MQCEAFEERLNAVLDERRRPEWDAELRAHSATCHVCRQLAATYQVLLDGFYELAAPEPPADMALRVLEARKDLRAKPRVVWLAAPALATAAALLIALLPLVRGGGGPPIADKAAGPGGLVQSARSAGTRTAQRDRAPLPYLTMLPDAWVGASDPYAGLAKGTGQNLASVMLYVPGIAGTKGIIDAEADSAVSEPGWADQMSEGLKPLSDSVAETINLILESLPVADLASR
jgi:hypothetical protein